MRRILIIGAGGIGSFLIPILNRLGVYDITAYDEDRVEIKNLSYQNFTVDDLDYPKVEAFAEMPWNDGKFQSQAYNVLVPKQLEGYDLVVCCADNLAVRRLLYKDNCGEDSPVKWLDLRAQGRNAALISYKIEPTMVDTVLQGPDGSFSCQGGDWDGSGEEVNCMHMAIAGIAAQWIQKWFNKNDDVIDKMVLNI